MTSIKGCKRQKAPQCLFCVATPNSPLQTLALKARRRHTLDWELAMIGRRKKGKMTAALMFILHRSCQHKFQCHIHILVDNSCNKIINGRGFQKSMRPNESDNGPIESE